MLREINRYNTLFKKNIEQGIEQGLYRENIRKLYKVLLQLNLFQKKIFSSEKESQQLELEILEYHTELWPPLQD
jgi:hypothetical protein